MKLTVNLQLLIISCYISLNYIKYLRRISSSEQENIDLEHFGKFAVEHLEIWRDIITDWVVVGTEVLVLHYEDFLQDKMKEVRELVDYLSLGQDTRRLQCVHFASLDFYKRKTSQGKKNMFTKELASKFNKVIEDVNQILQKHGHKIIKRK